MDKLRRNFKRIATDAAGYLLIVASILTGWLPGPGGIPLFIAGLGLLSINNAWAQRLRDYVLDHGGKMVKIIFPANPIIEWLYDIVAILLLGLVAVLAWTHGAWWQISLATALFFIATAIALTNRDRLNRLRARRKRQA